MSPRDEDKIKVGDSRMLVPVPKRVLRKLKIVAEAQRVVHGREICNEDSASSFGESGSSSSSSSSQLCWHIDVLSCCTQKQKLWH